MKNKARKNEFLRVKDKQVLWFNGMKWLVKETLQNKDKAIKKLKELEDGRQ